MLDDLRNSASQEVPDELPDLEPEQPVHAGARRGPFMGMTAQQRFVVVLLLFFMVCVLGSFCLLLTERIWLPFY